MRVSHETVYECLYLQARGELRTQLTVALRKGRTRRVTVLGRRWRAGRSRTW